MFRQWQGIKYPMLLGTLACMWCGQRPHGLVLAASEEGHEVKRDGSGGCEIAPHGIRLESPRASEPQLVGVEVLYDSLCLREQDPESFLFAQNYCGGEAAYGRSYDVQAADDITTSQGYFVTSIVADYAVLLGVCPNSACIGFYAESTDRCLALQEENCETIARGDQLQCENFRFEYYGNQIEGIRLSAHPFDICYLPAGTWFVAMQPSSEDFGAQLAVLDQQECMSWPVNCDANTRDGGKHNDCCHGESYYGYEEWSCCGIPERMVLSMRLEGIRAGNCVGGEGVTAKCKSRGDAGFNVIVKIRDGQPNGTVTALLDPPDPQSMSIALDGSGRGKGKFKGVPLGEHRVFVCDSIVEVTCSP